jgi:3-hydroxybutyryl-CoA dehydrogenase
MTSADDGRAGVPRRVGVVGAGVIGSGVAQALAQTGHEVVLVDVSDEVLDGARAGMSRAVRLHHLVAGTGQPLDTAEVMSRIGFTTDYEALADVDFVVENATESWHVKEEAFAQLDRICAPPCPLAANTSIIPISRIATVTTRPDRVIGIHFMNPVPLKAAVEVIPGDRTSERTLAVTHRLLEQMGKDPILVRDSPGFVSNRVLMLTVNEAAFLVHEQVATADVVDRVFERCFGHPMGPLATADLIGLDTVLLSIAGLRDAFDDDKFRPCPLLESLVEAGKLGRKSGSGFFDYTTAGRA